MSKSPIYGFPCVEDPNDFIPDRECCSPAEIEAHRIACADFGKPAFVANRGCEWLTDPTGAVVAHVVRTSWGIGVNLIATCDECKEPTDGSLMTCHECGGPEFCEVCWPIHERDHEEGRC